MPVRNMEQYLEESIKAILAQTFRNFELIVLDFGSTDRSKAIAASYEALDRRVKLHQGVSCGLAEARNAGCSLAKGRYIAVQDADDVSLPDRLMLQVYFMESHPDIGLLGGLPEWVDSAGRSMWVARFPTDDQEIQSALPTYFPFCHTSLLIRRNAFELVGGYRPIMTQSHDYDLALRISEHFRCANLSEVVVKYRVHSEQLSVAKRRRQCLCALSAQASAAARRAGKPDPLENVQEITTSVLQRLGITEAQLQFALAAGYQNWINSMLSAGDNAAALKLAKEARRQKYLDRSGVAELYFTAARRFWKEKRFTSGLLAAFHVLLTCPQMARRFVKPLRRRLGLA